MPVSFACERCGASFTRPPRDRDRGVRFCSRACQAETRKKGGNRLCMSDGYVRIYQAGGGSVPEHRLVAAKKIGRQIEVWEEVHHIDGNKSNNDAANLLVLSPKEHSAIHLGLGSRWAKEFERCVECGSTELPHLAKGLCGRCYRRAASRAWRASHKEKS